MFSALLKQQPYYEVIVSDSQILFGNPDARLRITILTNPFCNPCAKMHKRLDEFQKDTKTGETGRNESNALNRESNVCIQYIFSSFNEDLVYANRYFISIYLAKGKDVAWKLYSDWFERGKALKEDYFKSQPWIMEIMDNPEIKIAIEVEFQKHESWKEKTQLRATPTIIVNGYKMPDNYKIEDLCYFTEFNFEVK